MAGSVEQPGVAIEISELEREFGHGPHAVHVLSGIQQNIAPSEFLAILGPSGCGKSTLLRLIAGLDQQNSGSVRINGRARAESIGFVFQEAHLLPWRTLEKNVALPLELLEVAPADRTERVMNLLELVGLADARHRYPNQLSGGMQMRGSLARALVTRPKLLLFDEPFAALDEITRERLDGLLYNIWREQRFTALFVTHSLREAAFLAQRTIMLSKRPARIIYDQAVPLPEPRTHELRNSLPFNQVVESLYRTLLQAEGRA